MEAKVVVIDDDPGIRKIMAVILEQSGVSFQLAADGKRGLELVAQYKPDLAVVDIKLGTSNGVDVARSIYKLGLGTKIVFVTGYVGDLQNHIHQLPVVGILEKPFDIFRFSKLIQENVN